MLAASPDFPAPMGTASTVQSEVLFSRMDQLLAVGMGLPLATFSQSDGVYIKLFFSSLGEEVSVFVPTTQPVQFLNELRNKIVTSI